MIDCFESLAGFDWSITDGAYFSFVRITNPLLATNSKRTALDILKNIHIITVPGSFFGESGEGFLRLSYGSTSRENLIEACHRFRSFFTRLS